jgi:hypothetical protein
MNRVAVVGILLLLCTGGTLTQIAIGEINSPTSSGEITLTGTVSCSRCRTLQPEHKGYTRWSWALHSMYEGDDAVLLVQERAYRLQGDRKQLLDFMESKATVTGELDGPTLVVRSIMPAGREK